MHLTIYQIALPGPGSLARCSLCYTNISKTKCLGHVVFEYSVDVQSFQIDCYLQKVNGLEPVASQITYLDAPERFALSTLNLSIVLEAGAPSYTVNASNNGAGAKT
jgi:hypothetical protein